jgi:hypothetical protein
MGPCVRSDDLRAGFFLGYSPGDALNELARSVDRRMKSLQNLVTLLTKN